MMWSFVLAYLTITVTLTIKLIIHLYSIDERDGELSLI